MKMIIEGWLSIWLYVFTAMGIWLGVVTFKKWNEWSVPNRLVALTLMVLVFHVWEEWVIPGGLHYYYNLGSPCPDRYPMNELTDMITNLGGFIVGCIVLFVWGIGNEASITFSIILVVEVIGHTSGAIKSYQMFHAQGMTMIYQPGFATTMFGFLPILIAFIAYFVKRKEMPTLRQWVVGIIATVVSIFLIINLPETLLKSEDTPYVFHDNGFYEQYVESNSWD